MTIENIPWMIQGGLHSAELGRRLLYKATQGGEGVTGIGDLRVHQAAVADGTVLVEPGGATMVSRYPGVTGESYDGYVSAQHVVPVAPNGGGSTRYDMVVCRIDDWNMPGGQAVPGTLPTDSVDATKLAVIQGVSSSATTTRELALDYPAVALARVALPAATSSVTDAMVTDLRRVTQPRTWTEVRAKASTVATTETLTHTNTDGEYFPNSGGEQTIAIPTWATRAIIRADWSMVEHPGGNAFGECWVEYGPWIRTSTRERSTQRYGWNTPATSDWMRATWNAADDVYIPASYRGTSQIFVMKARVDPSVASGSRPKVDSTSGTTLDVLFLEVAAASSS